MNKLNILAVSFITGSKAINLDGSGKSSNMLNQLSSTCESTFFGGNGPCGGYGNNCGNNLGGFGYCGGGCGFSGGNRGCGCSGGNGRCVGNSPYLNNY